MGLDGGWIFRHRPQSSGGSWGRSGAAWWATETKDDTISLRSKVSDKHVSLENSSSDTWLQVSGVEFKPCNVRIPGIHRPVGTPNVAISSSHHFLQNYQTRSCGSSGIYSWLLVDCDALVMLCQVMLWYGNTPPPIIFPLQVTSTRQIYDIYIYN